MPLLSLPFDVLDEIIRLVVKNATNCTFHRPTDTEPPGFLQFYKSRLPEEPSVFYARLTCKKINDLLVRYLFRHINIRLGWDWLHINPPLRELVYDGNNVYRQNAKALRIGPLIRDCKIRHFQKDDIDRDHDSLLHLPLDVYDAYPYPKSAATKQEELQVLVEDIRTHLAFAVGSLSNVEEFIWELHEEEYPGWFHSAVTTGLHSLKNVKRIQLYRQNNWRTHDQPPLSLFRDINYLAKYMRSLTHLELNFNERVPPDYDLFWDSLTSARAKLLSIKSNAISMPTLEYIASYSGLQHLSFGHRTLTTSEPDSDMAAFMFSSAIPQHTESLQTLGLPVILNHSHCWSVQEDTINMISSCNQLHVLSTIFCVCSQAMEETVKSLKLLIKNIALLPSLDVLELTILRIYRDVDGLDNRNMGVPSTMSIMPDILKDLLFDDQLSVPQTLRVHVDILSDIPITYNFLFNKELARYELPLDGSSLDAALRSMWCGPPGRVTMKSREEIKAARANRTRRPIFWIGRIKDKSRHSSTYTL